MKNLTLGLLIVIFVFFVVLIISGESLVSLGDNLIVFSPIIVLFLLIFYGFVRARNRGW